MKLTAVIEKAEEGGWVGQFEEFPAVIEQGETIEELKINMIAALDFYLDTHRWLFEQQLGERQVRKEIVEVA